MALSKKGKKVLTIISIILGIMLILYIGYCIVSYFDIGSSKYNTSGYGSLSTGESEFFEGVESALEDSRTLDSADSEEVDTSSKIIKSGTISLMVEDLDVVETGILSISKDYDGSVVSSYESGEGNDRTITITLKIPVESFDDVYTEIKDIDGEVTYASYYTEDITSEYTDLESRLRNLEATEEQLVEILGTAESVEDTLAVYEQLTDIRSRIEVLEGQIKYLDNQTDYSYVAVALTLSSTGKEVTDEEWNPLGILKTAFSYLVDFGIVLANLLIWIVAFSPVIAIVVIIVVLVKRGKRKTKGKKK